MNRRYTAQEYREKCEILRKYYPAPALTTDVITGFPGETEEEFEESRSFVDSIHFYETHIFPYSKREGTKAAVMPDQLPEQIKKERSRVLIDCPCLMVFLFVVRSKLCSFNLFSIRPIVSLVA